MPTIAITMKLHLRPSEEDALAFTAMSKAYMEACNFVSQYAFDKGSFLSTTKLHKALYQAIRSRFGLKAQLAASVFRTVVARYKAVREQLWQRPFRYKDENGEWQSIPRNLDWLQHPVQFHRPQADLVRNRDYSFAQKGTRISVNTLGKRAIMSYDKPECFAGFFDGSWSFGTGKLVNLLGEWYLHIPMTREVDDAAQAEIGSYTHIVGIDRGIRFLSVSYDEKGKTGFASGREIMAKRQSFADVRAELQSKGTKSAKRALKRISGRENRWMRDVNHRLTKALVSEYGAGTLFVIEDLTGISFAEGNQRDSKGNRELHSWSFYQYEQFLSYKAQLVGAEVLKVSPKYTSQRCPKCGRILKSNRHRETHEYVCDACGYRTNDDRAGAMNIQYLGQLYAAGDPEPKFALQEPAPAAVIAADPGKAKSA